MTMPDEKIYHALANLISISQIASSLLIVVLISIVFTDSFTINGSASASTDYYGFLQRIDSGYVENWNGHEYQVYLVKSGATWDEVNNWVNAANAITSWNAHLVTISSKAENDFLYGMVANCNDCWKMPSWGSGIGPWIGLYKVNGKWRWVDGEPVYYTSWEPGEPNNSGNHAAFAGGGPYAPSRTLEGSNWDDISPDMTANSFIIEYNS